MIDIKSLSADWLADKKNKYKKDPTIMESMIYALYLLKQLKLTGLDFIFKGGTSLVLLMEQPKRFSVDIDVIINPSINRQKLEEYLSKIIETSAFLKMELDERRSYKKGIQKAHYKFIFKSNSTTINKDGVKISNVEREILLDVLFAENPYPQLVNRPIATEWLIQQNEPLMVGTPDINSITGDKLTAFAPNTTGILYGVGKEKEIIKQLFDVGCLFDLITDVGILKKSFLESAKREILYRPQKKINTVNEVLRDIVDTAFLIAKKDILTDHSDKAKFDEISRGINQFGHFVFMERFGVLQAQVASSKAAYLAAIILTDSMDEIQKFNPKTSLTDYMITHKTYSILNKRLKFVEKGEALFYWNQTIKLIGLSEEDIKEI
jgi:Nucleotidyl transferase AbiEii toxin, Type IV TA system